MIAIRAGAAYFALVFALGFLLGTIRTLWLEPALGEAGAILVELPIMLAASLAAAVWLIRRFAVPARPVDRLLMGGIALLLLLLAELSLAGALSGQAPVQALGAMLRPARVPGLLAQLLFGLIPLLLLWRR